MNIGEITLKTGGERSAWEPGFGMGNPLGSHNGVKKLGVIVGDTVVIRVEDAVEEVCIGAQWGGLSAHNELTRPPMLHREKLDLRAGPRIRIQLTFCVFFKATK